MTSIDCARLGKQGGKRVQLLPVIQISKLWEPKEGNIYYKRRRKDFR